MVDIFDFERLGSSLKWALLRAIAISMGHAILNRFARMKLGVDLFVLTTWLGRWTP